MGESPCAQYYIALMRDSINIGCWAIGEHARRNIIPAIHKSKTTFLGAICTRNEEVLKAESEKYGCRAYTNPDDLLNDQTLDAIYICSPNGLHFSQAQRCLEAGKSILVEKTAFLSVRETELIIETAQSLNLIVMEAFMYRFHEQFTRLRSMLDEHVIGKVLKIDIEFGFPHLELPNIRYSKKLGGGALNDAGAYTISAARQLIGKNIKILASHLCEDKNYSVDTSGTALLKNNSATVACSWAFGASYRNRIEIWSEKYNVICDRAFSKPEALETMITLVNSQGEEILIPVPPDNHFVNMIEYFSKKIRQGDISSEYDEMVDQAKLMQAIRQNA